MTAPAPRRSPRRAPRPGAKPPAVALVAFNGLSEKQLQSLGGAHPGIALYTVSKEGMVRTLRGASVEGIAQLSATAIVWIGVPVRWTAKHGPTGDVRQFHIGHTAHFEVVRAQAPVLNAIRDAVVAAQIAEAERAVRAEAKQVAHMEAVRIRRHRAPPPLFVPPGMG